ncbi:hypothetical protein [Sediminibacterium goheungense]|uniref:Restriction endonuclease n=1 Tax=Sediminibacterium goheungense TaxID=1086393 RepID=A0A4R6J2L2_9BACT|nr:hypothetical protein [Sediminibacterium goheungense]TDO28415.1 hypothetical protein BC659_0480 [Sediminibacterium goheungense]
MVENLFKACVQAIEKKILIERANSADKEFHFQNWIRDRIKDTGVNFDAPGRNSFPDFLFVDTPIGFEVKGLAYPGRDKTYDGNSQVPKGLHNGREIFYIFGRYPKQPDGNKYPVLDLIISQGSFLNADSTYTHQNKNAKGFGSYGDIMIRDRKMYVIPTPFSLADGLAHNYTLILDAKKSLGDEFICVGELARKEADNLLTSYSFNLKTNEILVATEPNVNAGKEHFFKAWRLKHQGGDAVSMRALTAIIEELENLPEENE